MIIGMTDWAIAYTSIWSGLKWLPLVRQLERERAREEMRVYGYNPPY